MWGYVVTSYIEAKRHIKTCFQSELKPKPHMTQHKITAIHIDFSSASGYWQRRRMFSFNLFIQCELICEKYHAVICEAQIWITV